MDNNEWLKRVKEQGDVADGVALDRQTKYGPENIGSLGVRGLFPRINDKVFRIKKAIWDGEKVDFKDEKLYDAFIDLRNYAQFGMMLLKGTWYE